MLILLYSTSYLTLYSLCLCIFSQFSFLYYTPSLYSKIILTYSNLFLLQLFQLNINLTTKKKLLLFSKEKKYLELSKQPKFLFYWEKAILLMKIQSFI